MSLENLGILPGFGLLVMLTFFAYGGVRLARWLLGLTHSAAGPVIALVAVALLYPLNMLAFETQTQKILLAVIMLQFGMGVMVWINQRLDEELRVQRDNKQR